MALVRIVKHVEDFTEDGRPTVNFWELVETEMETEQVCPDTRVKDLSHHYYVFVVDLEKHLPPGQFEGLADKLKTKGSGGSQWSESQNLALVRIVEHVEDLAAGDRPNVTFWESVETEMEVEQVCPGTTAKDLSQHYITHVVEGLADKLKTKGTQLNVWSSRDDVTLLRLVKQLASSSMTGDLWEQVQSTEVIPGKGSHLLYRRYYHLFRDLRKRLPSLQFLHMGLVLPVT